MNAPLRSWGRYPDHPQTPHGVYWRNEIPGALKILSRSFSTTLPVGLSRSYGDSAMAASDHVLACGSLNRLIDVDWTTGLIKAEAGLSLYELLRIAAPKGWFLPVTPGTQFVTLGGAVANDVHGKNHHARGSFGLHVKRLGLMRSDRGALTCSATENADLFAATIGGLGLTGVIDWVELQLMPVRSGVIEAQYFRFGCLSEFFALTDQYDSQYEYSAAWIDCLAKGDALGRGVLFLGRHAQDGGLSLPDKRTALPFTPPVSVVNGLSVRLFTTAYYARHARSGAPYRTRADQFLYPLDGVRHWNRIYGPKGFQQYQCAVPQAGGPAVMSEILRAIAEAGLGSFLVVLKRFGHLVSPGLLSFPMAGPTLALDFPQDPRLGPLFARLDRLVHEAGGRLYPAKDAHMSGADFRRAFPRWEAVETLRDPALNSRFWMRATAP